MRHKRLLSSSALSLIVIAAWSHSTASAQTSAAPATPAAPPAKAAPVAASPSLDALAWLRGCWKGSVNQREFREQWSPQGGGMMVGISHTVVGPQVQGSLQEKGDAIKKPLDPATEKTQDFEYLRLEARVDGVYYLDSPSGKKELAFKLTDVAEDKGHKIFTFTHTVDEFPQRIVYRHATEGWLYAQVMAKPGSHANDVTYPMRHVDCLTDAFLPD
jgi:hypothetical protein